MNYTELKQNIKDICESEFSNDVLDMFTQQAEQKIYNSVQIPALRKNVTGTMSIGNSYLQIPSDFLYVYSLAVIDTDNRYYYLIDKDVNFIREAYPYSGQVSNTTTPPRGRPKHYAIFDNSAFILGPTPNLAYSSELHYGYYPESIVTAGTTWLGDEFDSALLNGALIEAIRFMKGEADVVGMYTTLYTQAIALLKQLGDGKLRQDTYRSGQVRVPVG
jgi:hypothetical protein|tara:strand:+ start:696 stop:1349 length:654 start_codon:yes stop_codon:yes gene_type:complete